MIRLGPKIMVDDPGALFLSACGEVFRLNQVRRQYFGRRNNPEEISSFDQYSLRNIKTTSINSEYWVFEDGVYGSWYLKPHEELRIVKVILP